MADAVLKEFLVGLGFKIDQGGLDKFSAGIDSATKFAIGLGEAAAAAAVAVAAAVVKMSESFDQLYWQTQRLGSSATDIKSFGYALSQLGGSAQGAQNSLESLAEFSKSSPGAARFLENLGVSPKDIGNAAATARDLGQTFKTMPYYRAKAFASVLGIDPISLQAMIRDTGQFEGQFKTMAHRMGKLFGENFDDAAGAGNKSMTKLRELKMEFGMMFDFAMLAVLEKVIPLLDKFEKWVDDISSGQKMGGFAGQLKDILTDLGNLGAALEKLATSKFATEFAHLILIGLDGILKTLTVITKVAADLGNHDWKAAKRDLVGGMGVDPTEVHGDSSGSKPASISRALGLATGGMVGANGASVRQNAQTALAYFKSAGMGDDQAKGITAALFAESHLNPNNVNPASGARGIGQWLGGRTKLFASLFGHDLAHSTFAEQLQFVVYEMRHKEGRAWRAIKGAHGAMSAAATAVSQYERPGLIGGLGDDARAGAFLAGDPFNSAPLGTKGKGAVVINQKTEIHVAHNGNSKEVAAAVTTKQAEVNQKLVSDASVYAF